MSTALFLKWLAVSALVFLPFASLAMLVAPVTPSKAPVMVVGQVGSLALEFWLLYVRWDGLREVPRADSARAICARLYATSPYRHRWTGMRSATRRPVRDGRVGTDSWR